MEYNLIGVQLPANAKQILLRFDDLAYERGKIITIVALLACAVLFTAGVVSDRRRYVMNPREVAV